MPSRGGRSILPRLFDSLGHQTDSDFEVIVVVDGDIDGTAIWLRAQQRAYPVTVIVFDENRGRSAALNAGFAAASGDVLVRCDDDMQLVPTFVETMAAVLDADEPLGVSGISRDVYPAGNRYGEVYGVQADRTRREALASMPDDLVWNTWAALAAVTRETWERVGDYDTSYTGYGFEDVDWGYRAHVAGVRLVLTDDVVADHLKPALSTRQRVQKAYASGRARYRFRTLHGLDTTRSGGRSPWNLAVRAVSRVLTPRTIPALTGVADALIRVLPRPVARKVVALLVEAAAR